MNTFNIVSCRELSRMSAVLLVLVRNEQWDDFTVMAEKYVLKKQETLPEVYDGESCDPSEKQGMRRMLTQLVDNEEEILRLLKVRLVTLKHNMMSLNKGAQVSQTYARQQVTLLH